MAERVGAIVLAAGSSRRLGRPKQLLVLDGKPLLQHVVDAAADAELAEIVVVLGHATRRIRAAITLPAGGRIVDNLEHAYGQSTSLRAGIEALGPRITRALVLLGDQPRIAPDAIRAVAAARGPICRANYRQGPGHPVSFARAIWPELVGLRGDSGARDLIAADPGRVHDVAIDRDRPTDIDTEADAREAGARV